MPGCSVQDGNAKMTDKLFPVKPEIAAAALVNAERHPDPPGAS